MLRRCPARANWNEDENPVKCGGNARGRKLGEAFAIVAGDQDVSSGKVLSVARPHLIGL